MGDNFEHKSHVLLIWQVAPAIFHLHRFLQVRLAE